jgi:hypothetical protein
VNTAGPLFVCKSQAPRSGEPPTVLRNPVRESAQPKQCEEGTLPTPASRNFDTVVFGYYEAHPGCVSMRGPLALARGDGHAHPRAARYLNVVLI